MDSKRVDPNAIESHTQAHMEAIDAMAERIAKAMKKEPEQAQKFGSQTHKGYPRLGGFRRHR